MFVQHFSIRNSRPGCEDYEFVMKFNNKISFWLLFYQKRTRSGSHRSILIILYAFVRNDNKVCMENRYKVWFQSFAFDVYNIFLEPSLKKEHFRLHIRISNSAWVEKNKTMSVWLPFIVGEPSEMPRRIYKHRLFATYNNMLYVFCCKVVSPMINYED